jgi:hypothetical protein
MIKTSAAKDPGEVRQKQRRQSVSASEWVMCDHIDHEIPGGEL